MPWIWSCHKCHTRYLLGATRRCLNDGHYFCGGVTVDKFSGRVKKHRACVSEFDYTGWEEFSEWKRATTGQIPRLGSRHCEEECNFPSSCHWNEEQAAHKTEPEVSPVKGDLIVQKGIDNYTDKAEREAKRHKSVLSTIEEEEDQRSSFFDATPTPNGLGLHNPVMDFSSSENDTGEGVEAVEKPQVKLTISKSQPNLAQPDNVGDEEAEMRDWTAEGGSLSRPIFPCARTEGMEEPFDFRFEQDDGAVAFLADQVSPLSPMYTTAWRWTAEEIGLALSPPGLPREGEM